MNTKELRQKILDLAIRGKLVPQDPNDEPASVLLERIKAEKQQMVKDRKLKAGDIKNDSVIFIGDDSFAYEKFPDGTVKCIEDELPFEIPEGWVWCRLGVIGEWGSGATPSRKNPEYYIGNIPWLKTGDLNDSIISETSEMISEIALEKTSVKLNPIGSVLIAMYGATIGKLGILSIPATTNQACCACIPILIYNKYLFYFLMSNKSYFIKSASGGAQPNISKDKIVSTLFPLPPLAEQHRIADKLSEIMSVIDKIESDKTDILSAIQLARSKILDLAIRGKLVPQDPSDEPASVLLEHIKAKKEEQIRQGKIKRDKNEAVIFKNSYNSYFQKIGDIVTCIDDELPFELPDGWEWCRGANSFMPMETRKPSGNHFKYIDIDSVDNKHQVIKEVKLTETAKAPSRANRAVFDESVLFSLVRPYLKNIALIDSNNSDSIASTGFYVATSNGIFDPEYLYILMISDYVVDGLNQFMKGDNSPSISKNDIEKWLYPVPPLKEQKRIADKVSRLFSLLDSIEENIN